MKTILSFIFIVFLMGIIFLSVFIFTESGEKIVVSLVPNTLLKPLYKIKKAINPNSRSIKKKTSVDETDPELLKRKQSDKTNLTIKQSSKGDQNKKVVIKKSKQLQNKKVVISVPCSPVYEKPDLKSKILTYLFRGDEVKIVSEKSSKSFIKLDSAVQKGYIQTLNLEIFKNRHEHKIFISYSVKPGAASPYQCLKKVVNSLYHNRRNILADLIFPLKGLKITINPHNARNSISKESIRNCNKKTILVNKAWSYVYTYGWILKKARYLKYRSLFLPAAVFMEKTYLLNSGTFRIRIQKYGKRWFCSEFIVEDNPVID
ncbi:MAG: hypothetical protein KAR07_02930 [Spirochaetes bacterium]|nr:hypothetical protein [Spirochaetota bacterium]